MKEGLNQLGIMVLRIASGLMMATHGYGKIFEPGRMERFTQGVGNMGFPLPEVFAWAAALAELAGGIMLAFGLATRVNAFFIAFTMVIAAFVRHGADPFEDKELALLYLAVMFFFLCYGGGKWALDTLLAKRNTHTS